MKKQNNINWGDILDSDKLIKNGEYFKNDKDIDSAKKIKIEKKKGRSGYYIAR